MLKRTLYLILFLASLSLLSGYLLSKASWIGKLGISLFYSQYGFLKIWWQGALIVFAGLLLVLILTALAGKALKPMYALLANIISLLLALCGLYFTYSDFRSDISHRLLGERFHIGAYLFWIGWLSISLFYLFSKNNGPETFPKDPGSPSSTV